MPHGCRRDQWGSALAENTQVARVTANAGRLTGFDALLARIRALARCLPRMRWSMQALDGVIAREATIFRIA